MTGPKDELRRLDQRPRKRFGQHFLRDPGIAKRIVRIADLSPDDAVLEIGPGLGALTADLLATGARLVAIEKDRDLAADLTDRFPRLEVHQADALHVDLEPLLSERSDWVCVANLPYNVGTRIVVRLLDETRVARMVVMLQREVAERLVAGPGVKARGSLSIAAQARAEVTIRTRVPPGAFYPPPKVESAVVELRRLDAPSFAPLPPANFERVVRAAFATRRKTLRNTLGAAFGKELAVAALLRSSIDPGARAEALTVEQFCRLAIELEE